MVDLQGTPEEIYEGIVDLDEDEFDEVMADPESRERVIDALLEHMAERLRPEAAGDLDAVIHIKLWDRPGGGYDHHELVIRDGRCEARTEPGGDPDLTLKVRPGDLRKIVTGDTGPKRLAFRGRLRALGDVRLGMRLTELFDL
jgi:putative sterol carrier protein